MLGDRRHRRPLRRLRPQHLLDEALRRRPVRPDVRDGVLAVLDVGLALQWIAERVPAAAQDVVEHTAEGEHVNRLRLQAATRYDASTPGGETCVHLIDMEIGKRRGRAQVGRQVWNLPTKPEDGRGSKAFST